MADTALSGLTEATSVASTDLFYVVVDPSGVALSQKITLANLANSMVVVGTFVPLAGGTMTGELLVRCVGTQQSLGPDNSHTYQVSVDASGNATLSATGNVTISPTGGTTTFSGQVQLSATGWVISSFGSPDGVWASTNGVGAGGFLILASTGYVSWNLDTYLRRAGAGHVQLGDTASATPVDQTFSAQNASGANVVGAKLTFAPGVSTGNATPASVVIQSTVAGSSGSTPQTLSDTLTITAGQILADPSLSKAQYSSVGNGGYGMRVVADRVDFWAGGGVTATLNAGGLILNGIPLSGATTIKPGTYTVATLPTGAAGMIVYCSDLRVFNGTGTRQGAGVGTGGLVVFNGTNWVNADAQSVTAAA